MYAAELALLAATLFAFGYAFDARALVVAALVTSVLSILLAGWRLLRLSRAPSGEVVVEEPEPEPAPAVGSEPEIEPEPVPAPDPEVEPAPEPEPEVATSATEVVAEPEQPADPVVVPEPAPTVPEPTVPVTDPDAAPTLVRLAGRTTYHRVECPTVKGKTVLANTLAEAGAQGLSPCRRCRPPLVDVPVETAVDTARVDTDEAPASGSPARPGAPG